MRTTVLDDRGNDVEVPPCPYCGECETEPGADCCAECAETERRELNGDQSEPIPEGSLDEDEAAPCTCPEGFHLPGGCEGEE